MKDSRRTFLKQLSGTAGLILMGSRAQADVFNGQDHGKSFGVLVDTTLCVGCRSCEQACNDVNTDLPRKPLSHFKDLSILDKKRRMDYSTYTVVNRYYDIQEAEQKPVFAKFQCMHCLQPACKSACIVGAFSSESTGAVQYDSWKCIGCRYCMAACPFQVPAYEYRNAFTPKVRKCTFCQPRISAGELPACVQACPMEVMTFGPREELLREARAKLSTYPERYVQHIYGENEVGGTSWLYLASVPFEQIGLPKLGYHPTPGYTEPIQHAIFKYFLPPLGLYSLLGGLMWFFNKRKNKTPDYKGIHAA
jgi:Fe-S-cluster-containing dehydrogenase component